MVFFMVFVNRESAPVRNTMSGFMGWSWY